VRTAGPTIELSASDLSQFLGCRHRTALDLAVARGQRPAPSWVDPALAVLQERGLEHEHRYADLLRAEASTVVDLSDLAADDAVTRSVAAMEAGTDVVLQPAFRQGRWFGRPDVLRRVELPSRFGPWSYEVVDTKLAANVRGGAILQLALYSELVSVVQGVTPERFHVVTPDPAEPVHTFRVQDFAAYVRLVRDRLEATLEQDPGAVAAAHYPEPVEHCEVCRWWSDCDRRRHEDDHLCLVAGISRLQSREIQGAGIGTLTQLATTAVPLPFTPRRGAVESYVRVREQARVQLEGRRRAVPVHELLPLQPDEGLARLPAPSRGDVFLDLEGDPFARLGGREYLFGLMTVGEDGSLEPAAHWAFTDTEERSAFEAVVDTILRRWDSHPGMHVYHYAPYEPAAFKRLMGRHATREAEIDRMLRAELFVDLYAVVKQGLRASVERYSIKDLEPFYGLTRDVPLADARTHLRVIERALELGTSDAISEDTRVAVEGYNRDDCVSALRLRAWLEDLRASVEASGTPVPRPSVKDGAPSEPLDERGRRVQTIFAALTHDVPADRAARSDEERARWLLAHLLEWHRREGKAPWWEFFRLRELPEDELFTERAAIGGLRIEAARVGGTKKCPVDRYRYPPQETEVREGDALHLPDGTRVGTVEAINRVVRSIEIKKSGAHADTHPSAVFAHSVVNTDVLAEAVMRIAEDVVTSGVAAGTRYRAARELPLNRAPRLRAGTFQPQPTETAVPFAVRIATDLDESVLAIQGPPGAGKTFTGARMICALVKAGARVGITAVSHKVIRNLLDAVVRAAAEGHLDVRCGHKVGSEVDTPTAVEEYTENRPALARLAARDIHVLGGTQFLWASPDAHGAVDVLFVDEAGQMSLTNVLAASQAARSVVLLGDPQQLEQPQQGTHPEGADVSALEHILGEHKTIPPERGIFLPETWRLAPSICAFTSEVFYEGRLRSHDGLDRQVLAGAPPFEGAGLWVVPVSHDGNQSSSREEIEAIDRLVTTLLGPASRWVNHVEVSQALTPDGILVIAPYNSQVTLLNERLGPRGIRVGTVDRFQGQEAPVVIYSMATSTPEDAPHGMEFLYSLNRLNVATSRARCACILVASPRLFEPECKSPRQMQLANAVCRYVELGQQVRLG